MEIAAVQKPLLDYLLKIGTIKNLTPKNPDAVKIWSRKVLSMIQNGESGWEPMLPPEVVKKVKEKKLFGFKN